MSADGDKTVSSSWSACGVCGGRDLFEFTEFPELPRVTSDTKPWPAGGRLAICQSCGAAQKILDPTWREEISRIYRDFDLYHQSGGAEQPIFTPDGEAAPRSKRLVAYLKEQLGAAPAGRILDFGCGRGDALASFAEVFPDWRLYGAELSDDNRTALEALPNFERLYTGENIEFDETFDLIILVHALEHVPRPTEMLARLSAALKAGGALFVQVPDCGRTPYDFIVADHATHFTQASLSAAARLAGLEIIECSDAILPKELTLLARPGASASRSAVCDAALADARRAEIAAVLDRLSAEVGAAQALRAETGAFGLFGTAISATWLAGALDGQVDFFVDEDAGRVGRAHFGRPILAPTDAPADGVVFMPLIQDVADKIRQRLTHAPGRYVMASDRLDERAKASVRS